MKGKTRYIVSDNFVDSKRFFQYRTCNFREDTYSRSYRYNSEGGAINMITINICSKCGAQFMIPTEYSDGLDTTFFVCPECFSKHWEKL